MIGVLFLLAYTCSGLAGLVYEVSWTRLLTLELGRTMAASSTVLAVFMGGLAAGSASAGRIAMRMSRVRAVRVYAVLECAVAVMAIALPLALHAMTPLFAWAYRDGDGGMRFAVLRLAASVLLLLLPTFALGATFPFAIRGFASGRTDASRRVSAVYAANTVGAAVGAALAGFVLLPTLGLSRTLLVGASFSILAALLAFVVSTRSSAREVDEAPTAGTDTMRAQASGRSRTAAKKADSAAPEPAASAQPIVAAGLLAVTGAATFSAEVAWTRVLALLVGPSTYAFAAVVAVFVAGTALGATVAASLPRRVPVSVALTFCLAMAAVASVWSMTMAGSAMPQALLLNMVAASTASVVERTLNQALIVAPMSVALGAAFPLALRLAGGDDGSPRVLGVVYAVNTLAGVVSSLATGYLLVPVLGLEHTLLMTGALLTAGAVVAAVTSRAPTWLRVVVCLPVAAAVVIFATRGEWDRELLASGAYKYAAAVPPGLDVESTLRAGTLVYYKDGAQATVSVRRLTGVLSLAIDGKVDASTGGDMLTQKLLAHVPLLLHGAATRVAIVGLGSGITAASALSHPIESLDVLEISPEVAEASRLFATSGRSPLDDRRTRLLVADGRTHLALGRRTYDVIIAEPSNPWMAGVAALFTQEYFQSARARLAPGGVVCQWVNTYDISSPDLRSVVATFTSVFPHATLWMAGEGDLLMIGSADPLEPRLANVERGYATGSVRADLQSIRVSSPFVLLSMFVAGEASAARFGSGVALQDDDRMALEFSAPLALHTRDQRDNVAALRSLDVAAARPEIVARA
ncbi:MAG: fused MFS/spermidine synthase, partial [Vicinamibacterales bacterium]